MTDIYSKAVFTVIAAALSVIAWNQTFNPAQAQLGEGCGTSYLPCVIENAGLAIKQPLLVEVVNTYDFQ